MKNQKSPITILLMVLGAVVFFHSTAQAGPAIRRAEAASHKAAKVGGEWRDTKKMIQSARDAAQKHDFKLALQLATEAQHQGQLGYKQVMQQQHLKFPAYLQ